MKKDHALMRHACYRVSDGITFLDPDSVEICRENIRELVQKVGVRKFVIHSSPKERARLTREVVAEELESLGCKVELPDPTPWLTPSSGAVNMDNLLLLFEDEDAFHLVILHKPQICDFLDIEEDKVFHGAIFQAKDKRIN